jgi:two-component system, OmpR family, response regulator
MRVLIAEDEVRVAQSIARAIRSSGYIPHVVSEGEEAWFQGSTENFAATILDLGLPVLDGMTILKRWRKEGIKTPVVILSARGSWSERVEGIDAGADDYLAKPFEMAELMSRLRAVMRRNGGVATPSVETQKLRLDLKTGAAFVDGQPVNLTPLEFRLLHYLAINPGRTVPQVELAENLYSFNHEREGNAIEAAISRLRKKLGGDILGNKRGFGYFLNQGSE